jgi:transposase
MLIIGCDYHPSVQQIAFVDTETGDYGEHRLKHSDGEAEKFYRDLKLSGASVRVGLEATGHLMTHPGVGPVTALAFVLIIGYPERFRCGKQVGSYVGLIPEEASSGVHRRLGHISKQGSTLLRFLLVEAAQAAARFNPEWRSRFLHLALRRERRIAKVAMARKLAVSLYWMWRKQKSFQPSVEVGSYAG